MPPKKEPVETFTHDEFLRALEMNGKLDSGKVTEKSLAKEEADREKRLRQAAEAARARQQGRAPNAEGKSMEEYTHEDYIQAMTMMGRVAPVTAETLAREEAQRQRHQAMLAEVQYKKGEGGLSLAQQWEKDHEQEESKAEQILRQELKARPPPDPDPDPDPEKKEPGGGGSSGHHPTAEPPPEPVDVAKLVAEAKPAEPSGPPNELLQQPGHSDCRNHCLAVLTSADVAAAGERGGDSAAETGAGMVHSLREKGCAVSVRDGLASARAALSTHLEQKEPQRIALVIVVDLNALADTAELEPFIAWVHEPSPASPPPPVVVVYPTDQKHGVPPEVLELLQRLHRPPYVLATVNWQTALRFAQSQQKDVGVEEELAVLTNLVPSGGRTQPTADAVVGAGMVIARGKDHDLRMHSSASPVTWLEVGMHWKGEFDLDLSCILLNQLGAKVNIVFFANLAFGDGAFAHSGDIMTAPRGDKEAISVDLRRVPQEVRVMYFVITSYGGEPFQKVEKLDGSVTVGDASGNREAFAQFDLGGSSDCCALVLCRVYRTGETSWGVTKVAQPHPRAETARALVYTAQSDFHKNPPPIWAPLG
eukprot:TRINITY_DN7823_c0_g3_i1.p1 TRINITY_DN7823_c0_g3~~TRINITY_DN7823_c0_g3_i1.p1  ORF type:complete len:623 (+),score=183.55 TRINITY_DN7823_c0_g3_i1:96-1871(+)